MSGMDAARRRPTEPPLLASIGLRDVLDSAPDMVFCCDAEGRLVWLNSIAEAATGTSRDRLLGQPFTAVVAAGERRRIAAFFARERRRGAEISAHPVTLAAHDGRAVRLAVRTRILHRPDGEVAYVGVARELGEGGAEPAGLQRRLEALSRMLEDARALAHMKSEALTTISHEIRTPMNGVMGLVQLLLESNLDRDQRGIVEIIHNSGRSLLSLLNDTLEFSRLEAGKLQLEIADFDLASTLNETAALLAPLANEKGLAFDCRVEPDVPLALRGDANRLRQIVVNLVGNGIKFTETGGVTVAVSRVSDSPERVELEVRVADTGIGIEPENVEALFRPFQQADVSIARRFGGTGLGLSISRQLVELMGGTMGVESVIGKGSTFWFRVGLAKGRPVVPGAGVHPGEAAPAGAGSLEPAATATEAEMSAMPGAGLRILIVEDNHVNQLVALWTLQKLGYTIETAATGAAALEAFGRAPFDLVLLDLYLPDADGLALARKLRAAATDRRVPIVAMTGFTDQDARQRCLDAGMDDYVTKPIDLETLCRTVVRLTRAATPPGGVAGTTAVPATEVPAAAPAASAAPSPAAEPEVFELDSRHVERLHPEAAPAGETGVAPVNLQRLEEMCMGVPQLRDTLIQAFLSEVHPRLERLESALTAGDAKKVEFEAHGLKGMSGTVGALGAAAIFETIEQQGRDGQLAGVDALLERVRREVDRVCSFIRPLHGVAEAA